MKTISIIIRFIAVLAAAVSIGAAAAPAADDPHAPAPNLLLELGSTRFRGSGEIASVAFSPDGKYLVGGGSDGAIWVWTAESGQVAKRLPVGLSSLGRVGFSGSPPQLHCYSGLASNRVERHSWTYPEWKPLPNEPFWDRDQAEVFAVEEPLHRLLTTEKGRGFIVRDPLSKAELLVVRPTATHAEASISPNGKLLAISSTDSRGQTTRFDIWAIDERRKLHEWAADGIVSHNWVATPDGKFLVAGSAGHDFVCWNLATGEELSRLKNKVAPLFAPIPSPDGKLIVIQSATGLNVFEIPEGKFHCSIATEADIRFVTFSPDGKLLATCGHNSLALVFDANTGHELLGHEGHDSSVVDLQFSQDGRQLLSIDAWQNLIKWNLAAKKPEAAVKLPDTSSRIIATSDAESILAGRRDPLPLVWKIKNDTADLAEYARKQRPFVAAVSRNGKLLIVEPDGSLDRFDAVGNKVYDAMPRIRFRGHLGTVAAVALSADAAMAASLDDDRTLRVWTAGTADATATIALAGSAAPCLALADSGTRIAAFIDGTLHIWKSTGGEPLVKLPLADEQPVVARFSPDGEFLLVGTKQGRLHLCGVREAKWLHDVEAHPGGVNAMVFTADGSAVFTAGQDGAINAWNPTTLEKTATIDSSAAPVLCLTLFQNDKQLAAGDEAGKLIFCDIALQRRVREMQRPAPIRHVAVSAGGAEIATLEDPDRRTYVDITKGRPVLSGAVSIHYANEHGLVAISGDGQAVARAAPAGVRVWRTGHDQDPIALPTVTSYSNTIEFSHSGKLLAAGGFGFCVWDLTTRRALVEVSDEIVGKVTRLAFSPDDRFLVPMTGHQDSLQIWSTTTGRMVSEIRIPKPFVFRQVYFSADSRVLMLLDNPVNTPTQIDRSKFEAWEIASGGFLAELPLPDEIATAVAISSDQRQLALGLGSGLIRLYDFAELSKPLDATLADDEALSPAELWERLGSPDARVARSAVARMGAKPDGVVDLLATKLKGAPAAAPTDNGAIAALIAQLDGDDLAARSKASTELRRLGLAARPAISAALGNKHSPAAKARLELLLAARLPTPDDQRLREIRAVQVLERIATPAARNLLNSLAAAANSSSLSEESQAAVSRLTAQTEPDRGPTSREAGK